MTNTKLFLGAIFGMLLSALILFSCGFILVDVGVQPVMDKAFGINIEDYEMAMVLAIYAFWFPYGYIRQSETSG